MQIAVKNELSHKLTREPIDLETCWNAFFTSLAYAEKAASEECTRIAKMLRDLDQETIAKRYDEFAIEEMTHFVIARRACREIQPLSEMAKRAYSGEILGDNAPLIARLVAVHLVFEPAALAFLGYLEHNAYELVDDPEWAHQIQNSFRAVVQEEVGHVYFGRDLIRSLWPKTTKAERRYVRRIVKVFRAFLKAGLPSFFRHAEAIPACIPEMLLRYDHFFNFHARGLIYDET